MNKEQFIREVSKIEQTFEDEFRACYNSPELIWKHIIEPNFVSKNIDALHGVSKRFWRFDCWDKAGNIKTITIEALNEENATIIFKAKHENLGFDPPY